jgi:hypothetical protein
LRVSSVKQGKLAISERVFQEMVRRAAIVAGWKIFHPLDSMRSTAGWPDCVMLKGNRMIVAELKREGGKFTESQVEWLDAFRNIPGVEVWTLYPSNFDTFWESIREK